MSATQIVEPRRADFGGEDGVRLVGHAPVTPSWPASLSPASDFHRLRCDLGGIERGHAAALLEDAAVDDHGVDVVRLRRAHDRLHGIAELAPC